MCFLRGLGGGFGCLDDDWEIGDWGIVKAMGREKGELRGGLWTDWKEGGGDYKYCT